MSLGWGKFPRMATRVISEEAALAYTGDEDALPYLALNAAGEAAVRAWVRDVAELRGDAVEGAWMAEAGHTANETFPGVPMVICMPSAQTRSGRPERFEILSEHLHWLLPEEG